MSSDVRAVAPSGEQVELRRGEQRAVIVEVGGGLRSYRVGDLELLDGYAEDEMASAARGQTLIPWPNRLRDGAYDFGGERHQLPLTEPDKHNAIHGLVRWANWVVADRADDRAAMEHLLHPQDGYPFALRLRLDYALSDAGLSVRATATNVGGEACPYGAGAHPYLTVGTEVIDPATLRAPGARWMPTDDRGIPMGLEPVDRGEYDFRAPRAVGDTQLDTGYADLERDDDGFARVTLSAPDGGRSATLWLDEGYPYLMLFTGDSLPQADRRRRGLGIEPMTCAPNALQTGEGVRVLEPGQSFSSAWGLAAS